MNISKIIRKTVIFAVVFSLLVLPASVISVNAAEITSTVNLAYATQHESGNGYYWDNINKVLTLDNFNVNTEDDWGLRLPTNANNLTIELKGTNVIKAGKYALGCPGNVTVKGDGKLILESGTHAIFVHSKTDAHKFRIFDGEVSAKGGETAFYSEVAEFSMTGGSAQFSSDGDFAVNTRVFSMTGGKATVNGTLKAVHLLRLNEAELTVTDDKKALEIGNLFEHDNIKFMAGNSENSLKEIEDYNGEMYFKTTPVPPGPRDSIIFGEGTPITVDYILLGCAVVLVSCLLIIPIVVKKRKTKKLYARLESEKGKK
ncbi:MAG: hypothetical protein IKM46_02930 [Clostridia bacterium]|nr:hypothetical protein [Clostridia bacterium]